MTSETDIEKRSEKVEEKFFDSNAGDGTNAFDQRLDGWPFISVMVSASFLMFLIGLDQTIIMPMLSTVGSKFGEYDKVSWITSGYMLTMSVFAATWGNASIYTGRKWSLMLAVILFMVGSLVCALAPNMSALIVGRVIAGIGAGGIQTLVSIVVSEMVPIHKRPVVYVGLTIAFSFATMFGPLIGGGLTENVSWRWCFYINMPIAGVTIGCLVLLFNPPKPKFTLKEKLVKFDYLGCVLLTAGCTFPLLALTLGGTDYDWNSAAIICLFTIGGLSAIAFCVWNFGYSYSQIIPTAVIKTTGVVFPALSLFFAFFNFMASLLFITTYFQVIYLASPINTGVRFLPVIFGVVFSTTIATVIMKKTGHIKPISMFGSLVGAIGAGCLSTLTENSSNSANIGLLILPGVGFGVVAQLGTISAQLHAPKQEGSTILSTALTHFARSLGGALGTSLSQLVFNETYKKKVSTAVRDGVIGTSLESAMALLSDPELASGLDEEDKDEIIKIFVKALHNVFYMATGAAVLCFLFCCLYSSKKIPKGDEVKTKEEAEAERIREVHDEKDVRGDAQV